MTKTRTTTATSIIPLLLLVTACGTPTANPESAAPQTKTQTQTKTEKKPAPEPKKETPAEEKPEEQTPTAPEPATDPTSGEWTETMNSPSDLSGQLDEAWLRCSPPFCREGAPAFRRGEDVKEQPDPGTVLMETISESRRRMAAHHGRRNGRICPASLYG